MQILAQSWLVYRLSNSSVYLGWDTFFGQIPIFLFSLFGGVLADRRSRRQLLLGSQVVQMSCAFVLATLVATGAVRVWHIWCLSFVVGFAQAFGGPAYLALVPSLVSKQHLQNAIALNSIQFNVARILGPLLGGVALTKLGATWCFALNGLSFLAVIGSLLAIRVPFSPASTDETLLCSLKEGLRFIKLRDGMPSLVALAFLMTLLSYPLITFLPVFARDVLHGDANTFTMLLAFSGAGSVLGALVVAAGDRQRGQARRALMVMLFLGTILISFAFSRDLRTSAALVFVGGAALMIVFALNSSLVQVYATDVMRGRVMSVYNVAFRGGMPIGSVVCGYLIRRMSAPPVLLLNGVLLCFLAFYFLLVQRRVARL